MMSQVGRPGENVRIPVRTVDDQKIIAIRSVSVLY